MGGFAGYEQHTAISITVEDRFQQQDCIAHEQEADDDRQAGLQQNKASVPCKEELDVNKRQDPRPKSVVAPSGEL